MIIGLGHYNCVGKDTFADLLIERIHVLQPERYARKRAFAYEIKAIAHQLFYPHGLEGPEFYEESGNRAEKDELLPELGKTPRQLWLDLGEAVREKVHPRAWVDALLWHISDDEVTIITDVRCREEADAIRQRGGKLIRVIRPGIMPKTGIELQLNDYGWDFGVRNIGIEDDPLGGLRKAASYISHLIVDDLEWV